MTKLKESGLDLNPIPMVGLVELGQAGGAGFGGDAEFARGIVRLHRLQSRL